jgi:hypothetical protein
MNLKYQVSQTTHLEPGVVLGLIMLKLKDKNYRVISSANNSVVFDDGKKMIRSNIEAFGRFTNGKVEIRTSEKENLLVFSFKVAVWFPSLIVLGALIFGVINSIYIFPLVAFLVFGLQEFVRIGILKGNAEEILKEILSYENESPQHN